MDDIRQALMEKHCPQFVGFSSDVGMPLATVSNRNADILDVEYTAIAASQSPDFAMLAQKIDAQNNFVAQGFEHLLKENQVIRSELATLKQNQSAQPIVQYQQPQQQIDLMPLVHAQNQGFTVLVNQNQQTQLAMMQMASAMQKMASRPTTINHFVDNTVNNETHSVEIHGDNYGNINVDGIQKNGSIWVALAVGILTLVIGGIAHGK